VACTTSASGILYVAALGVAVGLAVVGVLAGVCIAGELEIGSGVGAVVQADRPSTSAANGAATRRFIHQA
jgi:hypothetical protein